MRVAPRHTEKRRFIDAHVHLWDEAMGLYLFPTVGNDFGLGDVSAFPTRFLLDDYFLALGAVDIPKFVHVTATATPQGASEETIWLTKLAKARGYPNAIIGTLDISEPFPLIERMLDRQMETPLYRGIRLVGGLDYEGDLALRLLALLEKHNLVYDAVAHPGGGISAVAKAAARHPGLPIALEHTGWPLQASDPEHWTLWKSEMAELAALSNSYCKLSGLGMTYHRTDPEIFRRYWDVCIELFGPNRCMFASNFPVDSLYGSFDGLLAAFEFTAARLPAADQAMLFGATAEHFYRI